MARFLSTEWVAALDAAAAALTVDDQTSLCVEYVVDRFTYHVTYAAGRVHFHNGAAPAPTVRLVVDRDTGSAVARGALSAQRAFMNGLLRIEGDTLALADALPALRLLGDTFAAVRASTEW